MADSVVAALRETGKGQLSPGAPWEACSASERIAILDSLTRIPPISPEAAVHRLVVQECPISPSTITDYQDDSLEDEQMVTTHHDLPNVSTPDTSFVADHSLSVVREQRQELEDYERITDDQIMNEVEISMQLRRHVFNSELEAIRSYCMKEHVQFQEELEREREREKAREKSLEETNKVRINEQLRLIHEQYQAHLMLLAEQKSNNEQKMLQQLQQIEERKKQEMLQVFEWCKHLRQEANTMSHRFAILLRACRYPDMLDTTSAIQYVSQAEEQIRHVSKSLILLESAEDPTMAQVTQIRATLSGVQPLLVEVKKCVEEVDEKGDQLKREEEEKEKQRRQEDEKKNMEKLKQSRESPKNVVEPQSQPEKNGEEEGAGKEVRVRKVKQSGILASSSTLLWYQSLQEKLTLAMNACTTLTKTTDRQVQKYRFSLQKAVNTPVCAISSQSGSHLLDKIRRLENLLGGRDVEVTGQMISIRAHPVAKLYCTNLMAMKLVRQGEEQAGSRPEAVFPIASVVVQIWSGLPEFGELFLAHCHASCPVLAPIYFTQQEGVSEGELFRLQGYQVSQDGTVESDDLFLKRMSGIVRLYAAVLVTPPREQGKAHPHGLQHGWTWLARVLNAEPQPTITATALYDFLEVAGYALMKQFGRQFKKLLFLLFKQFLPKIEKITPPEERGPLSRLKQFLEDCVSNGSIPQPTGFLSDNFWRSRGEGIVTA